MIAADLSSAPRVWRKNAIGMRFRVIDPRWLEAARAEYDASSGSADDIIGRIAAFHKVGVDEIMSNNRTKAVNDARHHAIYEVARLNRDWPNAMVATAFGLGDRSTIVKAVKGWPSKARRLGISCEPIGPSLVGPGGLRKRSEQQGRG